jgi:VanZ family protein
MANTKYFLYHWGISILLMAIIFIFSATPAKNLPNFGSFDYWVKKGGHMLGYGTLALSYWYGLKWNKKQIWWAWFLAVIYAISDEFHQSFIPGRHPSPLDVILFDSTGAAITLLIINILITPSSS